MSNPAVSVIICCYTLDRFQDACEAVASVLDQRQPPDEVIVSVDHNRELLGRLQEELPPSVTVVLNEGPRGLSETRNVGARTATGEVLAFVDDDARAERDWLEKLVHPFADPQVAAVGGRIVPLWVNGPQPPWFSEELYWIVGCTYAGMPVEGDQVRNTIGCNMALRAQPLVRAGFFSSTMGRVGSVGVGDETELSLRLRQMDGSARIVYEPEARVWHKVPASRLTVGYLLSRSWDEGVHKARIRRTSPSGQRLSVEGMYLRHLLFKSLLKSLTRVPYRAGPARAGAILATIAATGAGFAWGLLGGKPAAVKRTGELETFG